MSERVRVLDADEIYAQAKKQREVFYGKPVKRKQELPFEWPRFVKFIGATNAQIYHSDKMLNGGKWELYKHLAEGSQDLFINDAITRLLNDDGQPVEFRSSSRQRALSGNRSKSIPTVFYAESFEVIDAMPKFVSVLADNIGLQFRTSDSKFWEVRLPGSTLAAATHPKTKETFLLVYTDEGVHFLITGRELGITKHGIVG